MGKALRIAFLFMWYIMLIPFVVAGILFMWFYRGVRYLLVSMLGENRVFWLGLLRWVLVIGFSVIVETCVPKEVAYAMGNSPVALLVACPIILYDVGHLISAVKNEYDRKPHGRTATNRKPRRKADCLAWIDRIEEINAMLED